MNDGSSGRRSLQLPFRGAGARVSLSLESTQRQKPFRRLFAPICLILGLGYLASGIMQLRTSESHSWFVWFTLGEAVVWLSLSAVAWRRM